MKKLILIAFALFAFLTTAQGTNIEQERIILSETHWLDYDFLTQFKPTLFCRHSNSQALPASYLSKGCYSFIYEEWELHFCINESGQVYGKVTKIWYEPDSNATFTSIFLFDNNGFFVREKHINDTNGRLITECFVVDTIFTLIIYDYYSGNKSRKIILNQCRILYEIEFYDTGEIRTRYERDNMLTVYSKEGKVTARYIFTDPVYSCIVERYDENGIVYKEVCGSRRLSADD